MGNDGGSIPTRRELVKEAARNPTTSQLKETQKEQLAHRWSICPITHKPLAKPVVSDYTGELYSKEGVIELLLPDNAGDVDKAEGIKFVAGRVKSLKDVVEVQLEVEGDDETKTSRWVCPVTSKRLGPAVKAVYLVPCGHAFSQEAIKEVKSEQCVQCGTQYEQRDIIPILPSNEVDKASVMQRMETLRSLGLTHSLKKLSGGKKRKANDPIKDDTRLEETPNAGLATGTESAPADTSYSTTPRSGNLIPKLSNGIKHGATVTLAAKVLEEEAARKKRRALGGENKNLKSLFTSTDEARKYKCGDFMTRGFSIPANAKHE